MDPRTRTRFRNAKQYSLGNTLVSGCLRSDKVITLKNGKTVQDECQPSVLIADKDTEYIVAYFNINTKTNMLLDVKFDGTNLVVVSNSERPKFEKRQKPAILGIDFGSSSLLSTTLLSMHLLIVMTMILRRVRSIKSVLTKTTQRNGTK